MSQRHRRGPHHLSAGKNQDGGWSDLPEHLRSDGSHSEDTSPRRQSIDGEEHDMGEGWVESIAGLREGDGATDLLINGSTKANASKEAEAAVAGTLEQAGVHQNGASEFDTRLEHALQALTAEVRTTGEAVIEVGVTDGWGPVGLDTKQMDHVLAELEKSLGASGCDVMLLRRRHTHLHSVETAASKSGPYEAADVAVRRRSGIAQPLEVRVAIIGNVDSGKSTLVGVMTRSLLDDGRGLARSKVFKHSHEGATGRTSSIGQHNLCLGSKGEILNDHLFRANSSADYIARASKVITMVDLAGHERYFKTTAYGLTGHLPDYACLIIGANAGVVGMCKEHLGVALALKVPVFFLVTKVDICPEHVLKHTLASLQSILKKPGVKKRPFMVRTRDDVLTCARHIHSDALAPIFLTSSVTGEGLELVRLFYSLLPLRQKWHERSSAATEFLIDETFSVPGVGTVVAGTLKHGTIVPGATLMLGPDIGDGSFKLTSIKSIHYKRLPVTQVVAGQTAALALKKIKRTAVRKGMVLVDEKLRPHACWEFNAEIAILTHSTTIQPRYQAVIHCEIVRQAARVVAMDRERLRSGDRAHVRFRFLQRPEYLTPGTRFVFREGRTKGIGMVASNDDD